MSVQRAHSERGAALFAVVMFLMIMTLGASSFLHRYRITFSEHQRQERALMAKYLAEAGINKGLAMLEADSAYRGEQDTALGWGAFTVDVTETEGTGYTITSTGQLRDGAIIQHEQTLVVDVTLDESRRIVSQTWRERVP